MTLLASLPRIEEHRVPVVFDCPKCQATAVRGTAYNLRETIRLSERVPIWGWSSHWVRCSQCQAELHADCDPSDFRGASAATVSDRVHAYFSFPKRFLAIAGLAFGWAPIVGLLVAIAAVAANVRTAGWPRVVSIIGLVLTTVYNAVFFGVVAYWTVQVARPIAALAAATLYR